jgi:hypothetical protein
VYDPQAGFITDSTTSPGSPNSPVLTNPYQLPDQEWYPWEDKNALSPEIQIFPKLEQFDNSPILPSIPERPLTESPSVNPIDLTMSEIMPYGPDGPNDNEPLFKSSPVNGVSLESPVAFEPRSYKSGSLGSASDRARYPSRKRKSSSSASSLQDSPSPPAHTRATTRPAPPKKTAHNMIEKRYRTNLNDKIASLRDAVPSLRIMAHRLEHQSCDEVDEDAGEEDLGGLAPAHKLNKATILSKATEYIAHLERRNKNLAKENENLRGRVEGFQMMVMGRNPAPAPGIWGERIR